MKLLYVLVTAIAAGQTVSEKEFELGRAVRTSLEQRMTIMEQPMVTSYLERLAGRLGEGDPWIVRVFQDWSASETEEVIGLPDRSILIPLPALMKVESEADAEVLLARGIAQVRLRQRFSKPGEPSIVYLIPGKMPESMAARAAQQKKETTEEAQRLLAKERVETGDWAAVHEILQAYHPKKTRKPSLYRR